MQLIRNIVLLLAVCLCSVVVRAQVIVGSDSPDEPLTIDYSYPKTYEIGGITSSGTAPLDQRLLLFHVGDVIEVPGDKISKTVKNL